MTNQYEDDEQLLIREFDQNVHGNDAETEDEALVEVLDEDLDSFDLSMAYRDDGRNVRIADVPVKITRNEILGAQRYDDFCQTILARQDRHRDSAFFEDDYGILRRRHPTIHGLEQVDIPETLRHVYSIWLTTRNSQATWVRLVCIVTYAQRITGLKWEPISIRTYERVTHALRTLSSYENERTRYDCSPHEAPRSFIDRHTRPAYENEERISIPTCRHRQIYETSARCPVTKNRCVYSCRCVR